MKLIAENELRKLYEIQKRDPSGEVHTIYEGHELLKSNDGILLLSPEKPRWWNRQEAEQWLRSGV